MTVILISTVPATLGAEGLSVSGGVDGRYTHESPPNEDAFVLQGLFLNVRKVWSDEAGDRWIAVAQADFDDNFAEIKPYQVYLQYKGPLGKWNIRAGHFLLPFGLLATYDTERLVLSGLEEISLGIRKDTGGELLGRVGDWDYALAVTEGVGDERFTDVDDEPLASGRLAYVGEDWQAGFSALVGRALLDPEFGAGDGMVNERRVAFDATREFGPLTMRVEAIGGTDDGRAVGGGIVLADYALTSKLELNSRAAHWHKDGDRDFLGLGLTYQLWRGLFLRVADNYELSKEDKNELTTQVYFESSHQF